MRPAIVFLLLISNCVPAPKRDYTPDEVETVNDLSEVMRIHAHHADPLFAIRDQESFSGAEYEQMREGAAMIQATSKQLERDFADSFDEGFAGYARQLGQQAEAIEAAAEAEDAAASGAAISALKETCSACHDAYR